MNVSRHNTLSRTLALPLCARALSLSLSLIGSDYLAPRQRERERFGEGKKKRVCLLRRIVY